jgi:hypothetical protein
MSTKTYDTIQKYVFPVATLALVLGVVGVLLA